MNLAEKLIVAGLTGRPGPVIPGDRFAFVSYEVGSESGAVVLVEEATPFLALLHGVRRLSETEINGDESDPSTWEFFDTLPEEVRKSGDRDLIGFLIGMREGGGGWYSFRTRSNYLDELTAEVLPAAECVFAWDILPPGQESAFGLYSYNPVTFSLDWRTDTVQTLARQMRASGEFSAMPILADALQDAGCDNDDILNHCRQLGEHTRSCWVIALVLGEE